MHMFLIELIPFPHSLSLTRVYTDASLIKRKMAMHFCNMPIILELKK